MIRINLLGQARPKATKQAVPLEATMQIIFLLVALGLAAVVLSVTYFQQKKELDSTNARIAALRAEKQSLQQVKQDVDRFETQKSVLEQRINVIETLQKNRTGGQELLQMVANTVVRVDALWLTSLERSGDNLKISGEAGSINAVANFITQLRRSGYFDKVEIQEAKEDDVVKTVQTYNFTMTATVAQSSNPEAQPQAKPASAPPPQPAAPGRS
ncbi:MAG TPA: PilN domain-containing protein [Candidatus Binatus sp.]|jgi:Tfp pilus assembly protein PilN|nr:PilN domain-containing protein [Candidatus Binatus sp.]